MMAYLAFQIYYLAEGPNPMHYLGKLQSSQPQILQSFSTIISLFHNVLNVLGVSLDFIIAAWSAMPLPVMVGLAYRIAILYAAGKVVVALKRAQTGYDEYETALGDETGAAPRGMTLIIAYSRLYVPFFRHFAIQSEGAQADLHPLAFPQYSRLSLHPFTTSE